MLPLNCVFQNTDATNSHEIILSIITIQKNSERTIDQTLGSILFQNSASGFEHIIIDACSTDSSLEKTIAYGQSAPFSVRVFSQKDRGISDAFNRGVAAAQGDWIWFLNSDDLLASRDAISTVFSQIKTAVNENRQLIAHPIVCCDFEKQLGQGIMKPWPEKISSGMHLPHPGLIARASLFEKFGIFSESFSIAMDYEWVLRIIRKAKISAGDVLIGSEPLVIYSRSGVSSVAGLKVWRENLAAQLLHIGGAKPFLTFVESVIKVFLKNLWLNVRPIQSKNSIPSWITDWLRLLRT